MDREKQAKLIERNIGFYVGRTLGRPVIPPEHIYIPLTTRCNLKCKMCEVVKYPAHLEDEMTTDEVKRIIEQAAQMNISHLIFSGGEPLLRDDFFELAEYAAGLIRDVDVITNGMLFDRSRVEQMLDIRLNHITFSLDGLQSVNDSIRGEGVFNTVQSTINEFIVAKKKKGLKYPTLGINFTVLRENINQMLDVLEMAAEQGLDAILFQPVLMSNVRMGLKNENTSLPSDEEITSLALIIEQIIEKKEQLKNFVICNDQRMLRRMIEHFKGVTRSKERACFEGIKRIVVTCDGKAWSCSGEYGNLKKEKLQDSWLSPKAQEMRGKVKKCSSHCLQDCVYSPQDINEQVKSFYFSEENKDDPLVQKALVSLLQKIEEHIRSLSSSTEHQVVAGELTAVKNELQSNTRVSK